MKRIVRGAGFEDGEGDFDEFVEDSDDHGHLGFACGGEPVGEDLEARVAPARDQRGHEVDLAQMPVALGTHGSGSVQGGA